MIESPLLKVKPFLDESGVLARKIAKRRSDEPLIDLPPIDVYSSGNGSLGIPHAGNQVQVRVADFFDRFHAVTLASS